MARSANRDPLDKFSWIVDIEGFTRFGFTECSVPSHSINTHDYKEGGAHLNPRNIVNSISYSNVKLTRGVTNDTSFNRWATGFYDLVTNGVGSQEENILSDEANAFLNTALNQAGVGGKNIETFNPGGQYRRKVTIRHMNRAGQAVVTYVLYNAFPVLYKPASDFNSQDDDGFSVEELELSYEGFEVVYSGIAGAVASVVSGTNI